MRNRYEIHQYLELQKALAERARLAKSVSSLLGRVKSIHQRYLQLDETLTAIAANQRRQQRRRKARLKTFNPEVL